MNTVNKAKLIDKPLLPTLMRLAWPIVIGNAMQLMYNVIDTFWVGRLGPVPLAAISISFPIIFIVFSIAAGFSIAGIALVSQYTGADDSDAVNMAAGQVLIFSTFLALIFSGIGLTFGQDLLKFLGASKEVLPFAWDYFRIIVTGIPMIFIFFVFAAILEGIGDTVTPMKLKVASIVLNIVLDPFMIYGWLFFPNLGVAGAAYATVISRLGATLIGLILLIRGHGKLQLKLRHITPDLTMIRQIVRIGIPGSVGLSVVAVSMTILTAVVANFGTYALAAWGIGHRILAIIRMPSMGMARATGVLVGQHLGADQPKEAEKTAWLGVGVVFVFMLIIASLFYFTADYLMLIFTRDSAVIDIGVRLLQIGGFAYAFLGIQQVLGGALEGAGKTVAQSAFNVLTLGVLQIPLAIFLSMWLQIGVQGIWWGIFIAKIIGATSISLWFLRRTWQQKVINTKRLAEN